MMPAGGFPVPGQPQGPPPVKRQEQIMLFADDKAALETLLDGGVPQDALRPLIVSLGNSYITYQEMVRLQEQNKSIMEANQKLVNQAEIDKGTIRRLQRELQQVEAEVPL